jgi:nicotinamidase/pyrazinamidase
MKAKNVVFWDVDTQVDFMLPGGKLYVSGAERIIPNLKRLVDAARQGRVLLVSSADAHLPDDEEFKDFPPHCVQGTPGQKKIAETQMSAPVVVPNLPDARLPEQFAAGQQVLIEKRKLDVFTNPNIDAVLDGVVRSVAPRRPEFVVFGVVTEYCVVCAASGLLERGHSVAIVTDAIETLDRVVGRRTLDELASRGARLTTTDEALQLV